MPLTKEEGISRILNNRLKMADYQAIATAMGHHHPSKFRLNPAASAYHDQRKREFAEELMWEISQPPQDYYTQQEEQQYEESVRS